MLYDRYIFDCRTEVRVQSSFELYSSIFASSKISKGGSELQEEHFSSAALTKLNEQLFHTAIIGEIVEMSTDPMTPSLFERSLLKLTQYRHSPLVARAFGLLFRHYDQCTQPRTLTLTNLNPNPDSIP